MRESSPLRISIAVATYNGAWYLQEQLDSFLAQTRLPDEVVVIDDNSIDGTVGIISHFADTAPFTVRWAQNEKNLGYTATFNKALMRTTGDLIFLSDQDDVWFNNKIEAFVTAHINHPDFHAISCNCILTDAFLRNNNLTKHDQMIRVGQPVETDNTGCCTAFTRPFLSHVLPLPGSIVGHDSFLIDISRRLGKRMVLQKPLQYFRRHESNTSSGLNKKTSPPTMLDKARNYFEKVFSFAPLEIEKQIITKEAKISAISSLQEKCLSSEVVKHRSAIKLLEQEISTGNKRKMALSLPRRRRPLVLLTMARKGHYAQFTGIQSLLKDLIRRQET